MEVLLKQGPRDDGWASPDVGRCQRTTGQWPSLAVACISETRFSQLWDLGGDVEKTFLCGVDGETWCE
jgi:hypothetical protein